MKRPIAVPTGSGATGESEVRSPRAFAPTVVTDLPQMVEPFSEPDPDPETLPVELPKGMSLFGRLLWGTASVLVSLALGLAADQLIRDLFTRAPWLGWLGVGALALFVVALIAVAVREILAVGRLRGLDTLRRDAAEVLVSDRLAGGKHVLNGLIDLYATRPDMSRARAAMEDNAGQLFDGGEAIRLAERTLMAPLDARARALTAASARRVALVTAVSPRAVVDIAFVTFESMRLGGQIARLYGARPGLFGTWRLVGAILSHLAVTGGLVLTDGVIEQLVGQGLAARISSRLGEGLVNGLMTVRVGIAAMRVVRPLPFTTQPQPLVRDFVGELANVLQKDKAGH